MNTAGELLAELAWIGASLEPAGDRLILRAGNTAIPGALVNRLRTAKADLIATLVGAERGKNRLDEHSTFEARVIEWLNEHPAPSSPGRCAWCGAAEAATAVILPFGTEPETHTWLHAECWPAWHAARKQEAIAALAPMGISR
jgi:hypothetical protein